ncbi:MAG TPA: hypothetical protein PKA77_03000 [Chitinophagaceae bacterium]|jgi:hypothetical protein|nr:hypothetical protein [Chitinophagaceae bacterium]HMU56856.1 hypothetical protein [Chitinophagaceae bacterium]
MNKRNDVDLLVEQFIVEEKSIEHNPFLSTRVMAVLDNKKQQNVKRLSPVLRAAIVSFGFAAAVFVGFAAGNLYNTEDKKAEVVLVNDDAMEHFAFYKDIENE